ncbi:hypothetical protein Aph01nite_48860 [Acrocarpospora phusangensis]|uniref:Uncharacterized protein n=1 Tax=Acrocarpospora phusangensis TaxID=1070424 RepID=A0A919QCZ3_9ACTN|nr:hypothetical protein [Acrocarpospora phusangensis]GIH26576.1 hypothetical protein Aph01nite_48860 [Acrocarpospora phusangensis]
MTIAALLRNRSIVAKTLKQPELGYTRYFVVRRARRLIELNPALADPRRKSDLSDAGTVTAAGLIAAELPRVRAARDEIWRRARTDPEHLSLAMATIRERVSTRPPANDPRLMRRRLVATIVYAAAAQDVTLADPANIERLHRLTDRRLRTTERMLYDVGRADHRRFTAQARTQPGGPWPDGLERIFEYPRVPQSLFLAACHPDATTGRCAAPMNEWYMRGSEHLHGPIRTNIGTRAAWRAAGSSYNLYYTDGHLPDVETAIEALFTPSADYLQRNLIFCDHVIHALHLEALVFSRRKRGVAPGWLGADRAGKPAGWIRLYAPFVDGRFLGGVKEPAYFESSPVREADLQPGDHVIVYNHPAYQHATVAGVWRLENAIVVQSHPSLRMQGHGSRVYDKPGMWRTMIGLFNRELTRRRADVDGLAVVRGDRPNRVEVDSVARLRVGMRVEIADRRTDVVLAADRRITAIDHAGRLVTYDGADVAATPGLVLRRPRATAGGVTSIDVEGWVTLRRRTPPAASAYAPRHRRADWYLTWAGDEEEKAIRLDPARRDFVRVHQLVEYEEDPTVSGTSTRGWFPLWVPALNKKRPVRKNGLIAATEPLIVKPATIAGWTWFFDPKPENRDLVPVLRPREL